MKNASQAFVLILLAFIVTSAQTKRDEYGCRLHGPIATETVENVNILKVSEQYIEGPRRFWHTTDFDVTGKKIKEFPIPLMCGGSLFKVRVEHTADEEKRTRAE